MRAIAPVSPGEMLEEEFLKPLGLRSIALLRILESLPSGLAISLRVNVPLQPIPIYDFVSILV